MADRKRRKDAAICVLGLVSVGILILWPGRTDWLDQPVWLRLLILSPVAVFLGIIMWEWFTHLVHETTKLRRRQ